MNVHLTSSDPRTILMAAASFVCTMGEGAIPYDTTISLRRSRLRERVLVMLSSLGEAYPAQLARAVGIPATRVKWIMQGRPPYYREDLSLVGLGLAREKPRGRGRGFEITPKGRRKARSVTAAWARRATDANEDIVIRS